MLKAGGILVGAIIIVVGVVLAIEHSKTINHNEYDCSYVGQIDGNTNNGYWYVCNINGETKRVESDLGPDGDTRKLTEDCKNDGKYIERSLTHEIDCYKDLLISACVLIFVGLVIIIFCCCCC